MLRLRPGILLGLPAIEAIVHIIQIMLSWQPDGRFNLCARMNWGSPTLKRLRFSKRVMKHVQGALFRRPFALLVPSHP